MGVLGLSLTGEPLVALKEDLTPSVIARLANAFAVYLTVLLADSVMEQCYGMETAELRRQFSLCDTTYGIN